MGVYYNELRKIDWAFQLQLVSGKHHAALWKKIFMVSAYKSHKAWGATKNSNGADIMDSIISSFFKLGSVFQLAEVGPWQEFSGIVLLLTSFLLVNICIIQIK